MPGCCGEMKFRQRIAWIGVVAYIAGTALFFYYLFELSDAFNVYALDHVHTYHSKVCITRYSLIWFWPLNPLLVSKFGAFHFTESN